MAIAMHCNLKASCDVAPVLLITRPIMHCGLRIQYFRNFLWIQRPRFPTWYEYFGDW